MDVVGIRVGDKVLTPHVVFCFSFFTPFSTRLLDDTHLFILFTGSLVNALASAFSHGATLGSHEMMAPKYRVLSFGPRIVPGMTSGGGGSCAMLPHRNDVVLCQLMDADDASMSHWMASFACAMSSSPSAKMVVSSAHCHNSACCILLNMDAVDVHATHGLLEHA